MSRALFAPTHAHNIPLQRRRQWLHPEPCGRTDLDPEPCCEETGWLSPMFSRPCSFDLPVKLLLYFFIEDAKQLPGNRAIQQG